MAQYNFRVIGNSEKVLAELKQATDVPAGMKAVVEEAMKDRDPVEETSVMITNVESQGMHLTSLVIRANRASVKQEDAEKKKI